MRLLLDTHIVLWILTNDVKIPDKVRELLASEENEVYYSTASTWEIAIKHGIHPDKMPISGRKFTEYCRRAGFHVLNVKDEHVHSLETLKRKENAPRHNDPFDRIMVVQARTENMKFVTHDSLIPWYMEDCILSV